MKIDESFMRQFRWITPVLLFLLNAIVGVMMYMGKDFIAEVKNMKTEIIFLKTEVASINGYLKGVFRESTK